VADATEVGPAPGIQRQGGGPATGVVQDGDLPARVIQVGVLQVVVGDVIIADVRSALPIQRQGSAPATVPGAVHDLDLPGVALGRERGRAVGGDPVK